MPIRPATEADIPAIMAIERMPGFERFFGTFTETEHRTHLADPDCHNIVLHEGEVLGFALLRGFSQGEGHVRLNRLAAREPGQGHGQALLDHAKGLAFAPAETVRFWLRVACSNSRARHVYERNGFVLETVLPGDGILPTGEKVDIARYGLLRETWASDLS